VTSDPVSRFVSERVARSDRRKRLRTTSFSEGVDLSIRMFQSMGWTFLRLSAAPAFFCLVSIAFAAGFVVPNLVTTSYANNWLAQVGELGETILIGLVVGGPLYLIGSSSTAVLVTHLVSDHLMGNIPDERAARRTLTQNLGPVLALSFRELLLSLSGILVATFLLVVSAAINKFAPSEEFATALFSFIAIVGYIVGILIFAVVRSTRALAPTILILEGVSIREAIQRSRTLSKGIETGIAGQFMLLIVFSLLAVAGWEGVTEATGLNQMVQHVAESLPIPELWTGAFAIAPVYVVLWFILPYWSAGLTLAYYDRRIILEGFDIDALAADVWRADQIGRFQL
jgi:hypothetical protein